MPIPFEYRNAIVEYIREHAKPVDKYGHQPRLYSLAVRVGEGQTYDDDVLFAAAWLHDLGVFVGHRPELPDQLARWDNVKYACEKAPGLLTEFSFPPEKIPGVVEAIRNHQPSGKPVSLEATILRDADILEQLGAFAILRSTCKIGRDTRFSTFSDVVPVLKNALADLPGELRLARSHELASAKIQILKDFLNALHEEDQGFLF